MKKLIAIALISVVGPSAFASKARLQSLQNAPYLKDTQTIFQNPAHVHALKDFATFELGSGASSITTGSTRGEGGFILSRGEAKVGAYLGHQSQSQIFYRSQGNFLQEENPVEIFFGLGNWAASVGVSRSEQNDTGERQASAVARFGMDYELSEWAISAEFFSEAKRGDDEFDGFPQITGLYEATLDGDLYLNVNGTFGMAETTIATLNTEWTGWAANVGLLDRSLRDETKQFFYGIGVSYASLENETSGTSLELQNLFVPMIIGIEYNAATWLVARASVTQNILLSSENDEISAGTPDVPTNMNTNNTVVSAGLGIKWESMTLDGVLAASSTGNISGASILTAASLTYSF